MLKDRIKVRARHVGVTMQRLARELGLTSTTFYRKLECGADRFRYSEALRLAHLLEWSWDELMEAMGEG